MMLKKLMSAAVAGVLSVTSLALPTAYSGLSAVVIAADTDAEEETQEKDVYDLEGLKGVKPTELPYTLVADGVQDGKRQKNFILTEEQRNSTKLTVNFTTTCTQNASIEMYGFGTRIAANDYWENYKVPISSEGKTSFSLEIDIPKSLQGYVNMLGIGIWYPKDDSKFTVTSIECSGESETKYPMPTAGGDNPVAGRFTPVSENDQSGTCDFKDNGDGTATFTSTLSKSVDIKDQPVLSSDKSENRYEIKLSDIGIDDIKDVQLQSFQYVIRPKKDTDAMDLIEYAGDISVKADSDADTEAAFGKTTHRYMDRTAEEVEGNTDLKITDIHAPYQATSCNDYAKVAWDIPKSVQPYVDNEGTVGFNVLAASSQSRGDIDIKIEQFTVTYTRKVKLPYTETAVKTKSNTLNSDKDDSVDVDITSLALSRHDVLDAVKVSFTQPQGKMQTFVGGFGISLDKDKLESGSKSFTSREINVINTAEDSFEVLWILPESIRDKVWGGKGNNFQVGYYYGDDPNGTPLKNIKITGMEFYISRFPERDLVVTNSDDEEIEKTLKIKNDSDYALKMSIEGCTFASSDPTVATIDTAGVIHPLKEGETELTINTPKGQDVKIALTVEDKPAVTTAATTTSTTTTTATSVSTDESKTSSSSTSATTSKTTDKTTSGSSTSSSTTKTTTTSSSSSNSTTAKTTSTTAKSSATTSSSTSKKVTTTTAKTSTTPKKSDNDTTTTTTVEIDLSTIVYGDVNLDGTVDLADATWLAKFLLSGVSYPLGNDTPGSKERAKFSADLNGDGKVDALDLSRLIEFNLGKLKQSDLTPSKKK